MEQFDYKKYFLRIAYALLNKDLPSQDLEVKVEVTETPKPKYFLSEEARLKQSETDTIKGIYNKVLQYVGNNEMKSVYFKGDMVVKKTLKSIQDYIQDEKGALSKEHLKIDSSYLKLFSPKQIEFIKKHMLYVPKSNEVIRVNRCSGKPLTVKFTSHARERFITRTILISRLLPEFKFDPIVEPEISVMMKWFEKEMKECYDIGLDIEKAKKMALVNISNSRATHLNSIMCRLIAKSTYGNEKSNHYKYRDKNGNINFYRTYPYTFVLNINDNSILTTEIYSINDGTFNRNEIVKQVNCDTDKLFSEYLDEFYK